jgi:hypothetical protein
MRRMRSWIIWCLLLAPLFALAGLSTQRAVGESWETLTAPGRKVARASPLRVTPLPPGRPSPVPLPPGSDRSQPSVLASAEPPPASKGLLSLRRQIARTIAAYAQRPLNTLEHNPWELMHWSIAYGPAAEVRLGGGSGDRISCLGWLNMGGRCRGLVMLASQNDQLIALRGKGMQGHVAQYLAVLAQCRVSPPSPIEIDGRSFTVADLIETEQLACSENNELTFTLIAMAHYLHTDETWGGADGTKWSLPRLVEEEIGQPLRGAPCGGTHRLFGLAYACQRRREATGALDGVYVAANRYVRGQQQRLFGELQNPDGSFSTDWFNRAEDGDDVERKLRTSGHMLEFLVSTADQHVLYHPRTVAAVQFVADVLYGEPQRDWKIGPMCHALHALSIYQERLWGTLVPGAVAAYHGPMKAKHLATRLASTAGTDRVTNDRSGAGN